MRVRGEATNRSQRNKKKRGDVFRTKDGRGGKGWIFQEPTMLFYMQTVPSFPSSSVCKNATIIYI